MPHKGPGTTPATAPTATPTLAPPASRYSIGKSAGRRPSQPLPRAHPHCQGADCGDNASGDRFNGVCDKNGCDFQTFRLGNTTFYGNGSRFAIDSSKPVTVVTQFVTADGTDTGSLSEIRRFYKQGSKVPLVNRITSDPLRRPPPSAPPDLPSH